MAAPCIPRHNSPPLLSGLQNKRLVWYLSKPIVLESKEQDGEVDPYWEEFLENVDGRGTSLSAFARRLLISSLLYGHAAAWWTIRREKQLPPYKRNAWLECVLTSVKSTPSKSSAGGSRKGIHWLR